ncbi:hypothetical protein [Nocardia huaxiensis]|uniref:hypothetical protein n=1 Tax=Nocardia huaxiensis TaxID=2755382 RepID=UPI001E45B102|nr:hypothetical protein [Nocardia huaxiensis]UFS98092.1 hypothetical protein LPY97_09415 [Nocardia huaxiensis]
MAVVITVAAAIALAGCAKEADSSGPVTASTAVSLSGAATTPAAATSTLPGGVPADPTALRAKTCKDWIDFFTAAKVSAPQLDPNWTPDFAVKGIVKEMGESPDFSAMSKAQQDAVVAGVGDAAKGACTS